MARVVRREEVEAEDRAAQILTSARAEADALVSAAKEAAEAIRARAEAEGLAAARTETAALLVSATKARDAMLEEAEASLVTLALAAVKKIALGALAQQPELVRDRVAETLESARRARRVTLLVHPDDAFVLPELPGVELELENTMNRGDCIVRTDLGTFDARLEVQLERLLAALEA